MPGSYNPFDHYWLADDGRLFSSAAQSLVTPETDTGEDKTPWPRDAAGAQTDAALQDVLTPYNVFVNLPNYTADVRWRKIETGIVVNGIPFPCDQGTLSALNSATIYTESATGSGAVINWKLPDGSFTQLNKTEINELQLASQSFCQACYTCENDTLIAITAGTITTREQVDTAFAAINNAFTKASAPEGMMISETLLTRRR